MIYIAAHKKVDIEAMDQYVLLQVGAVDKEDLGYLRDDSGENISGKNPNFCELTGLYWIWKNSNDKCKGLVHYRRYFGKTNFSNKSKKIYTYQELIFFLKDYDIVLPYEEHFLQNARNELMIQCCTLDIFTELREIVKEKYPEYLKDFNSFFSQNKATLFNMMFCRAELFDEYCEWLFDILFELEKRISIDGLNDYQKRLYGFLGERLLNIWVKHKKLIVKNVAVINTESTMLERLNLIRRRETNKIRYKTRRMLVR